MKVRILGNSLRLRLSISEIERLKEDFVISDSICFMNGKLHYMLQFADSSESVSATFTGDVIKVSIPLEDGLQWTGSGQVGIEKRLTLPDGGSLRILIEKDFACLNPREGEDESNLFPNPAAIR